MRDKLGLLTFVGIIVLLGYQSHQYYSGSGSFSLESKSTTVSVKVPSWLFLSPVILANVYFSHLFSMGPAVVRVLSQKRKEEDNKKQMRMLQSDGRSSLRRTITRHSS